MIFRMISLGCPKNLVESEYICEKLCAAGHAQGDDGDTVIINTCAFIAEAARESIETILEAAKEGQRGLSLRDALSRGTASASVTSFPRSWRSSGGPGMPISGRSLIFRAFTTVKAPFPKRSPGAS